MVISTGQLTKMQERKEAASTDIEQASVQSLLQYRVLFRVVTLFHHITVVVILTSLNISQTDIHFLITLKKYSSRFITHWNFVIQIIYLVLTLLCDFLEWMRWDNGTVARKLTRVKDFCFSTLVFPNALFVTSTFWGLYALDRELISPKQMELTVPFWINHSTHTVILMVVLLDLVLQPGERPLNDSKNKITIYSFVLVYQIVLLCTYLEAGYWIYPLYNLFNVSQYFMFSVYNFFAYGVGYELQWPLISWTRKLREIKTLKML